MADSKVNLREDDKQRRKLLIKVREELTSEFKATIAKKIRERGCMSVCVLEERKRIKEREGSEPKKDYSIIDFFTPCFYFPGSRLINEKSPR